jgi:UDP-N-acetylglucosamine 2-epimerase (non-hydrolysing)
LAQGRILSPFGEIMKVLIAIGTRPEAIKMAPVIKALKTHSASIDVRVCLTAQHRELLDQPVNTFQIPVDYDLNLMRASQSPSGVLGLVLSGVTKVIDDCKPDLLLVHGDTTTALGSALSAYYSRVRVGHVEAGLRTWNKWSPYPEELNRRLADVTSDYHYAPTEAAKRNLIEERIPAENIVVTGNTGIDALLDVASRAYTFTNPALAMLLRLPRLIIVTAHRRENFGGPLEDICIAVKEIVRTRPDVHVLWTLHPNPNASGPPTRLLTGTDRVHLVPALDYEAFVHLLKASFAVLTDSGGIQEEAPSLDVPVFVLRDNTERLEGIQTGNSRLVGTSTKTIVQAITEIVAEPSIRAKMIAAPNPYGDGRAAVRIADHVASLARQ